MQPTLLGEFARLPVEVRYLIWEYFYPRGYNRQKTDLTILRTNSVLYNEIIVCLGWPESLVHLAFELTPEPDRTVSFRIYNGPRTICWNITTKWFEAPKFSYLPLDKLHGVVTIKAPAGAIDVGQLVCLWGKCFTLVHILNQLNCNRIRYLNVVLRDTEYGTWLRRGVSEQRDSIQPVNSLLGNRHLAQQVLSHALQVDDITILIRTFRSLRNLDGLAVHFSADSEQLATSGGLFPRFRHYIDDEARRIVDAGPSEMQISYDYILTVNFLGMDVVLDSAVGLTADDMRLERFVRWAEHPQAYENGLYSILRACKPYVEPTLMYQIVIGIWTRYGIMRFADPQFCGGNISVMMDSLGTEYEDATFGAILAGYLEESLSAPAVWYAHYAGSLTRFDHPCWDIVRSWLGKLYTVLASGGDFEETFLHRLMAALDDDV